MKRRLLVLLLLLLVAGAIVNVAVAWGCSIWVDAVDWWALDTGDPSMPPIALAERVPEVWFSKPQGTDSVLFVDVRRSWGVGVSETIMTTTVHTFGSLEFVTRWDHLLCVIQAGWPLSALETETLQDRNTPGVTWRKGANVPTLLRPVEISFTWFDYPRPIALRPIWPGFAINTVFYAAGLWLLFAAPFALRGVRRCRRIKRGLCPKCAYPVGTWGAERCTECGATRPNLS